MHTIYTEYSETDKTLLLVLVQYVRNDRKLKRVA